MDWNKLRVYLSAWHVGNQSKSRLCLSNVAFVAKWMSVFHFVIKPRGRLLSEIVIMHWQDRLELFYGAESEGGGEDETGEMDLFVLSSFAPLGGAMSLIKPSTDTSAHLTCVKNEFSLFYSLLRHFHGLLVFCYIKMCLHWGGKTHKHNGLEVFNGEQGILGAGLKTESVHERACMDHFRSLQQWGLPRSVPPLSGRTHYYIISHGYPYLHDSFRDSYHLPPAPFSFLSACSFGIRADTFKPPYRG